MNTDFENSLKQILYRSVTCSIQQGQNEQDTENSQPYREMENISKSECDALFMDSLMEILAPYSNELSRHGQDNNRVAKFALLACEGIRVSNYSPERKTALIDTLTASISCLMLSRK